MAVQRKGIILAGGTGSRLFPITQAVSKQLLPLYDKLMIFYPVTVLMLAGIRDIAVITTPHDAPLFRKVLGTGAQWGISFTYIEQENPEGLAQAYVLADEFLDGAPSLMILGDNIFFGNGLADVLRASCAQVDGATAFGYHVADPRHYGVIDFASDGTVRGLVEKPNVPPSTFAVTGLYALDGTAPQKAARLTPSARGELEIVSLLELYLQEDALTVTKLGRGFAWLDTGTPGSLLDAGNFVRTLVERQGQQIGCPEEVAFRQGWINKEELFAQGTKYSKTAYGAYLLSLCKHEGAE